jgi:hypothetical protein
VPGGAAGLQNWQARLEKVKREPGFINKLPFLFLYLFVSHSFTFCRYPLSRLIFGENWQHGGYMKRRPSVVKSACDSSTDGKTFKQVCMLKAA